MGDDGGLDRGASSDHTAGESFGLDVGSSESSRVRSSWVTGASLVGVPIVSRSVGFGGHSTRLRLVGGSSS
jgi:hypothetical protein